MARASPHACHAPANPPARLRKPRPRLTPSANPRRVVMRTPPTRHSDSKSQNLRRRMGRATPPRLSFPKGICFFPCRCLLSRHSGEARISVLAFAVAPSLRLPAALFVIPEGNLLLPLSLPVLASFWRSQNPCIGFRRCPSLRLSFPKGASPSWVESSPVLGGRVTQLGVAANPNSPSPCPLLSSVPSVIRFSDPAPKTCQVPKSVQNQSSIHNPNQIKVLAKVHLSYAQ
jgi:hypothetical protein